MFLQVDLCVEGHNLDKFSANFKGMESVKFPHPIWSLTRSNILVETYEEGQPMQNFVMDKSACSINAKLAELGVNTILKMVGSKCLTFLLIKPCNVIGKMWKGKW